MTMHLDDLKAVAVTTAQDLEDRFGAALAAKDAAALRAMFDDQVDFRAMTPNHIWEARTPTAVIDDVILGTWFASCDIMELVETADTGMVGDRHSFSYRLQGTNGDGRFVIEQRAYFAIAQGKITWMRVLCSGFHPLTGHP
jgi:hypothetical protein